MDFVEALTTDTLTALRAAPKTDVHSHALLSARRESVERWVGHPIEPPPAQMDRLDGMHAYIAETLARHILTPAGFRFVPAAGVRDAIRDGVVLLEMSFDIRLTQFYPDGLTSVTALIEHLVTDYRDRIDLRPELGIAREHAADRALMALAHEAIASGVFRSIDLYSHESACEPQAVQPLYAAARDAGLTRKAHVGEFGGEFGDAEAVRRTVEVLDLDEVQHGIAAAASPEVMRWLEEHDIRLNVCPTSNVRLGAVPEMASHPVRALFDNGVQVTLNTDDLLIFGQTVSEEYRNLYRAGVFSAEELDSIRQAALDAKT